jgi:hypothetical protein
MRALGLPTRAIGLNGDPAWSAAFLHALRAGGDPGGRVPAPRGMSRQPLPVAVHDAAAAGHTQRVHGLAHYRDCVVVRCHDYARPSRKLSPFAGLFGPEAGLYSAQPLQRHSAQPLQRRVLLRLKASRPCSWTTRSWGSAAPARQRPTAGGISGC